MAITLVGSTKRTPTASATSHPVTLPTGIANGNVLLAHTMIPTGSGTWTTVPTGFVEVGTQTYSGHKHTLWIKENASAADSGATATWVSSSAYRATIEVIALAGVPTSSVIDVWAGVNGPTGSSTTVTSPTVTTTAANDAELQFVGTAGAAGVTTWTAPSGLTLAISSVDGGSGGGATSAAIGYNLTPQASGSTPGGDVWTINSSNLMSAFTVAIHPAVAASTVRPSGVVSSTGWSNVGGAASIPAALADESDTTYAETIDNPSSAVLNVSLPELGPGDVTIKTRNQASASSPATSRTIALLQGTTVIASRTITLSTTATNHEFTTTTAETANITDRTALRLRVTDTVA